MKKTVVFMLVLLICAALPLGALAETEAPVMGSFEDTGAVTAPVVYGEDDVPAQEFEDTGSIKAPLLYEDGEGGMRTGTLVAVIVAVVVVAAAVVVFFLLRKRK